MLEWNVVAGPTRTLLVGLWFLWASLLVFSFLLGKPHADGARRMPKAAQLVMSAILVVAALVWWLAGTAETALAGYGLWIFLGMSFGFLGDLFMAGRFPVTNEKIFGIVAFAVGHLLYMLAFGAAARMLGLADRTLMIALVAGYGVVGAALWALLVRNPAQPRVLNVGTFIYAIVIAAMSALALALAVQDGRFWPLFVGTLSFVASDLILANQFMRGTHWRLISDVVWTTYTVGQMLIVYSTGAVLGALAVL